MNEHKSNSKIKAHMLMLSLLSGSTLIISIITDSSLIEMEHYIIDFAKEHSFLIGIISLAILTVSLAIFRVFDTAIKKKELKKRNQI